MSYDQHQLEATTVVCVTCGRPYHVTRLRPAQAVRFVCRDCMQKRTGYGKVADVGHVQA